MEKETEEESQQKLTVVIASCIFQKMVTIFFIPHAVERLGLFPIIRHNLCPSS